MSESDDSQNTRPISVAELLARNGTIGAPPAGGRRRRRRGNADAISVAELTGEIPVIRDVPAPEPEPEPAVEEPVAEEVAEAETVSAETVTIDPGEQESVTTDVLDDEPGVDGDGVEEDVPEEEIVDDDVVDDDVVDDDVVDDDVVDEDVVDEDVEAETAQADEDVAEDVDEDVDVDAGTVVDEVIQDEVAEAEPAGPPLSEEPLPRRESGPVLSEYPRPVRSVSGAEEMAPDPVDESVDLDELLAAQGEDPEELRAYLTASSGALFSGETIADDIARRGPVTEGITEPVSDSEPDAPAVFVEGGRLRGFRYALTAVFQSLLAVLFGAGLFLGFDQLWRWNTIVALVLSVLVILGLVVAVRVVRKTEDIASTLIAVAVGALVTLGPLALLQST